MDSPVQQYILADSTMETIAVTPEKLKELMGSGVLQLTNYELTAANRLRPLPRNEQLIEMQYISEKFKLNTVSIIRKLQCSGMHVQAIYGTMCNKKIYLATSANRAILIIPDDVVHIYNRDKLYKCEPIYHIPIYHIMKKSLPPNCSLTVVGGRNLRWAECMFQDYKLQSLNLSQFDTSKVVDATSMFTSLKLNTELDLSCCNFSNLKHADYMFYDVELGKLKMFNNHSISSAFGMFEWAKINQLDFNGFKTDTIREMTSMFREFDSPLADFSTLSNSSAVSMELMFNHSKINNLNLSKFRMNKSINTKSMFREANIQKITFNKRVKDISNATLAGCTAEIEFV